MELKDTVAPMLSEDYAERFRAEYQQLYVRAGKLEAIIDAYDAGTLEFTPKCSYELLCWQLQTMREYLKILGIRAEAEGIKL